MILSVEKLHRLLGEDRLSELETRALLRRRGIELQRSGCDPYGNITLPADAPELLKLDLLEMEAAQSTKAVGQNAGHSAIDRRIEFLLQRRIAGISLRGLSLFFQIEPGLMQGLLERVGLHAESGYVRTEIPTAEVLHVLEEDVRKARLIAADPERLRVFMASTHGPTIEAFAWETMRVSGAPKDLKTPAEEILKSSGIPIRAGCIPLFCLTPKVRHGLQYVVSEWARMGRPLPPQFESTRPAGNADRQRGRG